MVQELFTIEPSVKSHIVRSLSGVRGLTRETLTALTTTIESREWMRSVWRAILWTYPLHDEWILVGAHFTTTRV